MESQALTIAATISSGKDYLGLYKTASNRGGNYDKSKEKIKMMQLKSEKVCLKKSLGG